MFGEKMKKVISITLIFGMVLSGHGFTTLAAGVEGYVNDAEMKSQNEQGKNYYQMMYEEEYYQQTTRVVNANTADAGEKFSSNDNENKNQNENENGSEGGSDSNGNVNSQNLDEKKSDSGITEPEGLSDGEKNNSNNYDEEA